MGKILTFSIIGIILLVLIGIGLFLTFTDFFSSNASDFYDFDCLEQFNLQLCKDESYLSQFFPKISLSQVTVDKIVSPALGAIPYLQCMSGNTNTIFVREYTSSQLNTCAI